MGGYVTPGHRLAAVDEALARLSGAARVILTTHVNADGDGIGCQAALLSLLEARGVEGWVVNPTPLPPGLVFLLPDAQRALDAGSEEARAKCHDADLCVVVDTGERSRIGRVATLVADLPKLVIDHHPPGSDPLDGQSLRDDRAGAAAELVFDLLWTAGGPWTPSVVDGLYVAILTDTGSFRFSNVSPSVHRVVAELIERGASPELLWRRIYGQVSIRRLKLLEATLPTLDISADGRIAWMSVTAKTFRDMGCTSEDLDGLVDYPRELRDVEVGLLFRELDDGQVKVSLRSNGSVDVNALARSLGGGGHVKAAGALMPGPLALVRERVVALASESVALVAGEGGSPGEESLSEP